MPPQIAFTSLVYPALILAYMGQAAYLSKHHYIDTSFQIGFYVSVPGNILFTSQTLSKYIVSFLRTNAMAQLA